MRKNTERYFFLTVTSNKNENDSSLMNKNSMLAFGKKNISISRNLEPRNYASVSNSSLVANDGASDYFPHIFTDINGEEKRAVELAQVNMRVKRDFGKAYRDDNYTIPALSFADTGSFSGALSFALIAYLFFRSAFASKLTVANRHFLIFLSDTDGKRSVIKVDL